MSSTNKNTNIDDNDPNFYNILEDEIDSNLARMKKNVQIVKELRIQAAELEVETAALYHAKLWHELAQLKEQVEQPQENSENKELDEKK